MLIIAPGVRRQNRDIFSIFFNMKVYCVFSLESPDRGDCIEYTKYIFLTNKKKKGNNPKLSQSAAMGFFRGTQERVQNSNGKRAISVRVIEVLLLLIFSY